MTSGSGGDPDGGRLHVLDITKFYSASGGGVKTYLAAKRDWAAGRSDVRHTVVLPGAEDDRSTDASTQVYRIRGPRIPVSPSYRFLLSARKLRPILERERPHIVEIGSPFLVPWIARRAGRGLDLRFIGFYHCDLVGAYTARLMPPRPRALREAALDLTRRYIAAVYDRLDLTLAASPSTADLLRDCGVREVAVAPLGVDAARFHPSRRDPSWRRELDLPPDAPALLYAGRLCREKEVDVVMAAAPELHRRFGAVVVFVGAGHLGPEIDRLARELPAGVRRLEYQTDPDALARMLASADLYLAPFSYETFGLAALEAMASGVAVIASRSLALADLIDESCGRTFRPGDAGELVRAVGAALDAEPMALGRAARRRAEAYTWERTFERLLELYRAVAGHSSVPSERTSAAVGSARR